MTDKKYELTDEITEKYDTTLHRIIALRQFGLVREGQVGGFIESEDNLSHKGDAWISGNAAVFGDARVYGDAEVRKNADVVGDSEIYGKATISGNARASSHAKVFGLATVSDNATISGRATVCGDSSVLGDSNVGDEAMVTGYSIVKEDAAVGGRAELKDFARARGDAIITGDAVVQNSQTIYRGAVREEINTTLESLRYQLGISPDDNGDVVLYKGMKKTPAGHYRPPTCDEPVKDGDTIHTTTGIRLMEYGYFEAPDPIDTWVSFSVNIDNIAEIEHCVVIASEAEVIGELDQ